MAFHAAHVFGQWNPNLADRRGNPWFDRWCTVKLRAPERKPFMGYYDMSKQADMDKIVAEMVRGRLDSSSVCAYFNGETHEFEETYFIDGLNASEVEGKPTFYLALELLGSYKPVATALDIGWLAERMAQRFEHPNYQRIDGKPAVSLLHMEWVAETLLAPLGMSLGQFFEDVAEKAGTAIYWIANCETSPHWVKQAEIAKASAVGTYNWKRWQLDRDGVNPVAGLMAKNAADLMALYQDAWAWLLRKSALDIILPTIGGFWDVNDNGDKIGMLTPKQLRQHLGAAAALCKSSPKIRGTTHCALDENFEGPRMIPDAEYGRSVMRIHAESYHEVVA